MRQRIAALLLIGCIVVLPGCAQKEPTIAQTATPAVKTVQPTATPKPTATPTPEPTPTATPQPTPTPDPDAAFYSESGESFEFNPDGKHWSYKSPTLGIQLEKIRDDKLDITYYVADIHVRDFTLFGSGFANKKPLGNPRMSPDDTAVLYKAVYAQNGDYFTDRKTGIVIRDGVVYRDKPGEDDIMAITPDGEMLVFHHGDVTADELLEQGVRDTFAFGPILVEDGKMNQAIMKHRLFGTNPRSGFGMVSRGHYVGIVVDGRRPGYSRGINFENYAKLFLDRGCVVAYNFDGGQSSAMVFMGQAINSHESNDKWHGQRRVPDIFRIGTSDSVPAKGTAAK